MKSGTWVELDVMIVHILGFEPQMMQLPLLNPPCHRINERAPKDLPEVKNPVETGIDSRFV
jgi:hypothetical protein